MFFRSSDSEVTLDPIKRHRTALLTFLWKKIFLPVREKLDELHKCYKQIARAFQENEQNTSKRFERSSNPDLFIDDILVIIDMKL